MRSDELVFLHGQRIPRCQAFVDKHFIGYRTLQFMVDGAIELSYDGRAQRLEGRWFWPAAPGPHIRFHAAPDVGWWNHRYIAFRGPLADRWAAEGLFPPAPQPSPPAPPGQWESTFDEMLDAAHRGGRWGWLRAVNLLERLLIVLAEARTAASEPEAWVARVHEVLAESNGFGIDYAALAEELGMSLSTLRRRFRQVTGTSLHAHAVQCRIARARTLLGETDLPIKRIARELGYDDLYFFTRQFKQLTGAPPGVYRKSRQG